MLCGQLRAGRNGAAGETVRLSTIENPRRCEKRLLARHHGRKLVASDPEIPAPEDDRDPLAGLSLADLPTKKRERIV